MMEERREKETMEYPTTRFGPLEVSEDKIIRFVKVIPGFEGLRDFVLLDHDSGGVFKWLQSLENAGTAFLLTFPSFFRADYTVPFQGYYLEKLSAESAEGVVVFVMVSASRKKGSVSLNLKAPILFNPLNMKAMQCIMDSDKYECRFMVELSAAPAISANR